MSDNEQLRANEATFSGSELAEKLVDSNVERIGQDVSSRDLGEMFQKTAAMVSEESTDIRALGFGYENQPSINTKDDLEAYLLDFAEKAETGSVVTQALLKAINGEGEVVVAEGDQIGYGPVATADGLSDDEVLVANTLLTKPAIRRILFLALTGDSNGYDRKNTTDGSTGVQTMEEYGKLPNGRILAFSLDSSAEKGKKLRISVKDAEVKEAKVA